MMNKRGNLLPDETLKIIIAVICIVFLVVLITALYFSLTGDAKEKQGEASINLISAELTSINNGLKFVSDILVPNPSGWYIFTFTGTESKPNSCAGANCVCICEKVAWNIFDWQKRQLKKCDDKGSCVTVNNLYKKFSEIKIENAGTWISIQKNMGEIEFKIK